MFRLLVLRRSIKRTWTGHMQYTTSAALGATVQVLPARIHTLAVLCFVALALLGVGVEVSGGWLVWPPVIYAQAGVRRQSPAPGASADRDMAAVCWYVERTWPQPVVQGLLLHLLWLTHGHGGPAWGALVPWLAWACPLSGLLWPRLARQPEWWLAQRLALDHGTGLMAGQPGSVAVSGSAWLDQW